MTREDVGAVVAALVPELRAAVERLLAHERLAGELALRTALEPITSRLVAVETRPPTPGPPGEPGTPGPPGAAGRDGLDGKAGVTYCGTYVDGRTYDRGDGTTYAGSLWHCNVDGTVSRPGDGSKDWTLMVKRGRDGKDGRP